MKIRTWTTAEGEVLRLEDMTESHINNCIAMLHRRVASIMSAEREMIYVSNIMASDELDIQELEHRTLDEARTRATKYIKAMQKELGRRKSLTTYM